MLYILIGISGLGFKMMTAFSRYENGRQHGQTAIFLILGILIVVRGFLYIWKKCWVDPSLKRQYNGLMA